MSVVKILVSDTSVLIDLDRGTLVEATFRLPFEFTVPDLLYERELREHGGPEFVRLGLRVQELEGDGFRWRWDTAAGRDLCLFRTASPSLSRRQMRGRCYPGTGNCASSQRKSKSDATECCGCSTRCSSTVSLQ